MLHARATDDLLRQIHAEEFAEYDFAKREKMALLGKLTVAELRMLLIHYGYFGKSERWRWPRSEMIEALAEHMVEAELRRA